MILSMIFWLILLIVVPAVLYFLWFREPATIREPAAKLLSSTSRGIQLEVVQLRSHPVNETRTQFDGDHLSPFEEKIFRRARCPDCDQRELHIGSRGGFAVNIYCMAEECGSRFNDMGVFGVDRISDVRQTVLRQRRAYR